MLEINDVCLRAVNNNDYTFLFETINSPDVVRYNAPYKPVHEVNHMEWISSLLKDTTKEFFIIEYAGNPVGSVQLVDIDPIHRSAELKIRISHEEYRGKNIGTNSLLAVCQHAFTDLGLIRVWLRVFADNLRAIAVYKKVGFTQEGIMKKAAFINGNFIDVIVMAKIND